jgi:hypothetical protein
MAQGRERAGFKFKLARIAALVFFDHDAAAAQMRVVREIDRAHSARTELTQNAIAILQNGSWV